MKTLTLLSMLAICILYEPTDARPRSSGTRCLTEEWLVDEYASNGCSLDTSDPECVEPTSCPNGCYGLDKLVHLPNSNPWKEGTEECHCMYHTSMGEYNPVRLPKGVVPKVPLPDFSKVCQPVGCRNPKTRQIVPVGSSFELEAGKKCECLNGPDRTKLDSISFYHLECKTTFVLPPLLGGQKPVPKLPTIEVERPVADWPIAPEMPRLRAMVAPFDAQDSLSDEETFPEPFLPPAPKLPAISPRLPMTPKINEPSQPKIPSLPRVAIPKLPKVPSMPKSPEGHLIPQLPSKQLTPKFPSPPFAVPKLPAPPSP